MRAGEVIETPNCWLLDIEEIRWWSATDGEVHGRMMAVNSTRRKWTKTKYLGTVKGISEIAVRSVK